MGAKIERAVTRFDDNPLPTFIADFNAAPHDINVLPHMHSTTDIERLFPTIDAAPGVSNDEDFDAEKERATAVKNWKKIIDERHGLSGPSRESMIK